MLGGLPPIKELVKRTEEHLKGMVVPGTLFEELGFNYIGPVDGHDVLTLVSTLKNMRDLKGPQFLHIMTKGQGYAPAEEDPITARGAKIRSGQRLAAEKRAGPAELLENFGNWLSEMAADDARLMAVTPAMREALAW